jgi:hypothetical protein
MPGRRGTGTRGSPRRWPGLQAGREAAAAQRKKTEDEHLAGAAGGTPRAGPHPAGADVALAEMAVERARAAYQAKTEDRQAREAAAGRKLPGARPVPPGQYVRVREAEAKLERARQRQAAAAARAAEKERNRTGPGPVRNITDPDSRLMPVRGGGFIQGYNAQVVTTQDGLIIATRLTGTTGDTTWFTPMLRAAQDAAALITARHGDDDDASSGSGGRDSGSRDGEDDDPGHAVRYAGPIGLFLADAGYCSEDNLTTPGPDRLIATGKLRDLVKAARGDPADGNQAGQATRAMAARLQTPDGIDAYRHRGHIAETPNGNIKHNKAFRQFTLRGLPKASSEWEFITATVNLFKAISSGHLTHAALDALTG